MNTEGEVKQQVYDKCDLFQSLQCQNLKNLCRLSLHLYTQLHVIFRAEIERISLLLVPASTSSLIVFSGHWWAAADGGHFPGRPYQG